MRVRLRGVNTIRKRLADGSTAIYHYHRLTGTRLTGEPGTAAFIESLAAAERKTLGRDDGLCSSLIRDFTGSAEFVNKLAKSTQAEYRRMLTAIDAEFGTTPTRGVLDDPRFAGDVLEWRDKIAATRPREADNRMVVFSRMLSWAKRRHRIKINVLEGYQRIHQVDRSEMIWLPEHIEAFQRAASAEIWPVFLVALHTGLRQSDVRSLPWSAYDGAAITWRLSKRKKGSAGVQVRIPCTRALRTLLDGLPKRGPLILTTKTGHSWRKRYLAAQFDKARAKPAERNPEIAQLHFHDLRGTAITLLAEAEASVPEIAAITGHSYRSITSILEHYLPRTRHLAEMAIAKLENASRTKLQTKLQTGTAEQGRGDAK